ncbi:substrate-binding domain-containing protein [Nisaea sp.]|uniref:substrate-binding domain-containing protein n=1 Tax=Nisaea sp. TaxID=2024842 RepID=UPI0032EEF56C
MRKLLNILTLASALIAGSFGPAPVVAQGDQQFIELEAFLRANPDERGKSAAFAELVQKAAMPLGRPVDTPVTVHIIYPGLQEQTIGKVLREKPDFLIFTLDALRHKGMISRVLTAGHTKVILQNITTPLTDLGPPSPLLYVGFDHGVGSRMLADEHIRRAGKNARYAIFYGPVGYVSEMRGGTFKRRISALTDYELGAEYYVGFDRTRARKAALDLFGTDTDFSFVFAASTDIAHGISDALGELDLLGAVTVNGWGGGSSELAAIRNHEIDFTVMRMNDDNGIAMAEAVRMTMEGEMHNIPQVYSGAFSMVDQTTSDDMLETLIDRAFRYSR